MERTHKGGFSSIVSSIFGSWLATIKERVAETAHEFLDTVEQRALVLQKKMLRRIAIMTYIGAGMTALLLALGFYLVDVAAWPRFSVFLLLGIILLVIASVRANLKD